MTPRSRAAIRRALPIVAALLAVSVGAAAFAWYQGGGNDKATANVLVDQPLDPATQPGSAGSGSPSASASVSASASASASTKPSKTAGPGGNLPGEFPNAGNTGVPAGLKLKPMKGELIIRENNSVVEGIDLVGKLVVNASNVTVRKSRITAPTNLPNGGRDEFTVVHQGTSAKNLVMEDCEVDGSGLVYRAIMANNGLTVNRCELKNIGHGVEVGDSYTIRNTWIHSTTDGPDNDWHVDGIISSIGVNGLIEHNTIVLTGGSLTGAVSVGSSLGRIDNVIIRNNLLAGGNYTVYVQDQGYPATRIQVVDNRFSTMVNPKVGVYGVWYGSQLPRDLVRRGNTIYETGKAADDEPDWG
jgi:hypothetical protein